MEGFRFFPNKCGVSKIEGCFKKRGIAYFHISVMCISAWRVVEPLTKLSKRGEGLGSQLLEGGRRVTFLRGVALFHKK